MPSTYLDSTVPVVDVKAVIDLRWNWMLRCEPEVYLEGDHVRHVERYTNMFPVAVTPGHARLSVT
ncbi:uncharacterized protein BDW47DRAFT_99861 [Aspergillus candidus]|uniref:Uncharacterized protein n=1 Tax=Aspergillus candidus TaxID=41067 RepID=A0A2I2FKY9_ASPCN|nr:hypothetical protein BDW47DRAFT_99861 [Aspergillus candidus]PLB41291.1 hypothetical protein BDW47DRAFT_99861 [Aspergillus candidus]